MFCKHKLTKLSFALLLCASLLSMPVTTEAQTQFNDIEGHWAKAQINEALSRGIVAGVSNDTFAPNDKLTYEQFVTMIGRTLSSHDFIVDKQSGCKLTLINVDKAYESHKGDTNSAQNYRELYFGNNPNIYKQLQVKSDYLSKNNFYKNGNCPMTGWSNYEQGIDSAYPYVPDLGKNIDGWSIESLYQVPYIAGFVNTHNLTKNNGENFKDFSYESRTKGIDPNRNDTKFQRYFDKRVNNTFDELNRHYVKGKNHDVPITREDMALLLYAFLDYDQQQLMDSNQDFYDSKIRISEQKKDMKYRNFNSNYEDIPAVYQVSTVLNNPSVDKTLRNMGYNYDEKPEQALDYIPESLFFKQFVSGGTEYNKNMDISSSFQLTSRGIILSVSDAGLLEGSGSTTFSPKKTLTRAEGLTVALRLDQYLKERFNFVN